MEAIYHPLRQVKEYYPEPKETEIALYALQDLAVLAMHQKDIPVLTLIRDGLEDFLLHREEGNFLTGKMHTLREMIAGFLHPLELQAEGEALSPIEKSCLQLLDQQGERSLEQIGLSLSLNESETSHLLMRLRAQKWVHKKNFGSITYVSLTAKARQYVEGNKGSKE